MRAKCPDGICPGKRDCPDPVQSEAFKATASYPDIFNFKFVFKKRSHKNDVLTQVLLRNETLLAMCQKRCKTCFTNVAKGDSDRMSSVVSSRLTYCYHGSWLSHGNCGN